VISSVSRTILVEVDVEYAVHAVLNPQCALTAAANGSALIATENR
jgi:hypothetical protein